MASNMLFQGQISIYYIICPKNKHRNTMVTLFGCTKQRDHNCWNTSVFTVKPTRTQQLEACQLFLNRSSARIKEKLELS